MRKSCADCTRKHLAQALVISHELQWYHDSYEDNHLWILIGHLAEAGDQIQRLEPYIASEIRDQRIMLMQEGLSGVSKLDIMRLINLVGELVQPKPSGS